MLSPALNDILICRALSPLIAGTIIYIFRYYFCPFQAHSRDTNNLLTLRSTLSLNCLCARLRLSARVATNGRRQFDKCRSKISTKLSCFKSKTRDYAMRTARTPPPCPPIKPDSLLVPNSNNILFACNSTSVTHGRRQQCHSHDNLMKWSMREHLEWVTHRKKKLTHKLETFSLAGCIVGRNWGVVSIRLSFSKFL